MEHVSMSALPKHYRLLYASFIRLACTMILFALFTGILHRESTRHLSYANLAPGIHWEAIYHLALVHGHIFMIGVILPIITLVMLHFGMILRAAPLSETTIAWGKRLYHTGAGLMLGLFIYKAYHYVLSVRFGLLDFSKIETTYFAGNSLLKALLYGLSHTSMSVCLGIFAVGLLKTMPSVKQVKTESP